MACYRVELTRSAEKDLKRIDRSQTASIFRALEGLEKDPRPSGFKKLAGADRTFRIRVVNYLVVYEIEDDVLVVLVVRIAHRKDVYR